MDVSFSGAGFMGCYYFGVVNCWNKYIPRERVRRAAGASAGSLIAAYYLMDLPLDSCLKEIIEMTEEVRSRPLGVFDRSNQIVDVLPRVLDRMFPQDAHTRVNGRLFVSMTRLKDMKNVMVNQFDSKQDLIDALNCSCFIPFWSGNHVATFRGVKHIDGGFTNNLPVFDEHTIRVSCFSGASDIAPLDKSQLIQGNAMGMSFYMNWKNTKRCGRALWPPPPSYIAGLLEQGFHDTKDFILSNDLIQCERCFNSSHLSAGTGGRLHSKHAPTLSPAASPGVSRASSFLNLNELARSSSFRIKAAAAAAAESANKENRKRNQPRVHLKQHRQQQHAPTAALFAEDRSKSGRTIKRKCLERSKSELYQNSNNNNNNNNKEEPLDQEADEEVDQVVGRVSFATKLREKLQRVATSARLVGPPSGGDTKDKRHQGAPPTSAVPTILIEEPIEDEHHHQETSSLAEEEAENDRQIVTIMDIMKAREAEDQAEADAGAHQNQGDRCAKEQQVAAAAQTANRRQQRTMSESSSSGASSSSASTVDSALGLDAPSPTLAAGAGIPVSGSPAEKFFSSSAASRQVRAASLATSTPFTPAQQAQLARALQASQAQLATVGSLRPVAATFASAPSPLPSCPPSPNLNRHCTECIRLRQQARMDAVDESIRRAADLYGAMKSKDPEREFNSFRARLTGWLRQLGTTKYSYSFDYDRETATGMGGPAKDAQDSAAAAAAAMDEQQRRSAKGRTRPRRGSLIVTTPPSQIPSYD